MAGVKLLALLDDITVLLDDVAVLTKVAGKKTAGVLGDDLALNAQLVTGVKPDRELPVIWAVAKGSALNKVILVPAALLISVFLPVVIMPLLMLGGLVLCYEGFEKVLHKLWPPPDEEKQRAERLEAICSEGDIVQKEKEKIKGAIRTDFILSAEVVAISLAAVESAPLTTQAGALIAICALMTVGVYGLVALIVKMDDFGLHLSKQGGSRAAFGRWVLRFAPRFMAVLSFVGTAAMFLVGGGILLHGVPPLEGWVTETAASLGSLGKTVGPTVANGLVGLVAGALAVLAGGIVSKIRGQSGKPEGAHIADA